MKISFVIDLYQTKARGTQMNVKYGVIKEEYSEINKTLYGIFAYNKSGEILKEIHSCSKDLNMIEKLADECTKGELDVVHLEDIVEDFLYQHN